MRALFEASVRALFEGSKCEHCSRSLGANTVLSASTVQSVNPQVQTLVGGSGGRRARRTVEEVERGRKNTRSRRASLRGGAQGTAAERAHQEGGGRKRGRTRGRYVRHGSSRKSRPGTPGTPGIKIQGIQGSNPIRFRQFFSFHFSESWGSAWSPERRSQCFALRVNSHPRWAPPRHCTHSRAQPGPGLKYSNRCGSFSFPSIIASLPLDFHPSLPHPISSPPHSLSSKCGAINTVLT